MNVEANSNSNSERDHWFISLCVEMKEKHGWGWKRRLAEKVGVRETNVQTWLKSGRVPAAVRRAIELSDELQDMRKEKDDLELRLKSRWIEVEVTNGKDRYSVHVMDAETGLARMVAGKIDNLEDARAIAGIPEIKRQIGRTIDLFGLCERADEFSEEARQIKKLLDWPGPTPWERDVEFKRNMDELAKEHGGIK